jgi:RNA recognition motif-containing protein
MSLNPFKRLNEHLDKCIASMRFEEAAALREIKDRLRRFPEGDVEARVKYLEKEKQLYLQAQEFEKAGAVRDAIKLLRRLDQQAKSRTKDGEKLALQAPALLRVFLSDLPADTRPEDVKQALFGVRNVKLFGKRGVFTGRARVDFLRKDHADDAVAVGIVTIRGTEAKVSSSEDHLAKAKQDNIARRSKRVYAIGMPSTTTEEQVRAQFPNVKALQLHHRNKATFRAAMEVETAEAAQALGERSVALAGQKLDLRWGGAAQESYEERLARLSDEDLRSVSVTHCPLDAREEALLQAFPTAEQVKLVFRRGVYTGKAFVRFPTAEAAQAAALTPGVTVGAQEVQLLYRGLTTKAARREQRAEERSRSVYLYVCPEDTTATQVMKVMAGAKKVRLLFNREVFSGFAMAIYMTRKAACQAAAKQTVSLNGVELNLELGEEYKPEADKAETGETAAVAKGAVAADPMPSPTDQKRKRKEAKGRPAKRQKPAAP